MCPYVGRLKTDEVSIHFKLISRFHIIPAENNKVLANIPLTLISHTVE